MINLFLTISLIILFLIIDSFATIGVMFDTDNSSPQQQVTQQKNNQTNQNKIKSSPKTNKKNTNNTNNNKMYNKNSISNKPHNQQNQEKPTINIIDNNNVSDQKFITLKVFTYDLTKKPTLSNFIIYNNNQKFISRNQYSFISNNIQEGDLSIIIQPNDQYLSTLIITRKIEKDTYLNLIIPPKIFHIDLYIQDLNAKSIDLSGINFQIELNKIPYKSYTINGNNIRIPFELPSVIIVENESVNSLLKFTNSVLSLNFQNNKNYKDENLNIRITPSFVKNRYPVYKRLIILENKTIPLWLYLLLLPLLFIVIWLITRLNRKIKIPISSKDTKKERITLNTVVSSTVLENNPKVADYILLERLGSGATSIVYKAQNIRNRSIVALKLLHNHLFSESWFKERVQNEIEVNKILTHPNIVRMLDYDLDGSQPFIAFEFVEGKSLSKILQEQKRIPLNEALDYWIQILEALDYAHQKGIVHRDLKPDNILIDKNKRIKIMDFGISKKIDKTLNITMDFVGTPWYMSPEQIKNQKVDNRSDIYSLGVIVYQMLTGKFPFETSENIYAVFKAHMFDNIISSNVKFDPSYIPPSIEKIIRKMIEKDPRKRYQYCYEIIQELTPHLLMYKK